MNHAHDRRSPRHPDEDELVRVVDASSALRQLLAAASAPPSTAELKGRSQAIAHFRAAHRPGGSAAGIGGGATGWVRAGHRGAAGLARAGRRSSARLTVACAAVVALLGSTTAAATAGELPTALRNAVSGIFTEPPPAGDRPSPPATSVHPLQPGPGRTAPSVTGSPASPSSDGVAGGRQVGATARQLAGLCRAYHAPQAGASSAELLATPAFGPLLTAAGGTAGVDAFCVSLVGAAPRATDATAAATPAGRPIAHPHPTAAAESNRLGSGAAHAAPPAVLGEPAQRRGTSGQRAG